MLFNLKTHLTCITDSSGSNSALFWDTYYVSTSVPRTLPRLFHLIFTTAWWGRRHCYLQTTNQSSERVHTSPKNTQQMGEPGFRLWPLRILSLDCNQSALWPLSGGLSTPQKPLLLKTRKDRSPQEWLYLSNCFLKGVGNAHGPKNMG